VRVAIVGSGISGLVAAYHLSREHEVTLYEAERRLGGHTHTVTVRVGSREYGVDTGFIVYNERTYPEFSRLLGELGVATQPTEMSFAVRCEASGIEYAGGTLGGLFAQPTNAARPAFWRMLRDVGRFWRDARVLLASDDEKVTLGELLAARRYSREFVEWHLLPMGGAIWSAGTDAILEFPALAFARFFANHGLLQLRDRPQWRVIRGGSARYVEALVSRFCGLIRVGAPVRGLRRQAGGVELATDRGRERYDRVVVGAHADQALALLADPTPAELRVLGAIRYARNDVVLHTDASLLPRRRAARASWNVHLGPARSAGIAVTYDLSRLQRLEAPERFLVTLNRTDAIDPARVLLRQSFAHPVFDRAALAAQRHRARVSGAHRIHYCGAYWRNGFHEDGVASALDVVREIAALRR
jgi:predicted NAD/FAD-binding protein